jgi:hypothetical protein
MEKVEFVELSSYEMMELYGGKPLFYHLGEAAGFIAGTFISLLAGFKDGITGSEKQ